MNDHLLLAREDIQALDDMISEISARLETAPEGTLVVMQKKGRTEFYFRLPKSSRLIYINKSNFVFAKALAQKDYDRRVLKKLTIMRAALLKFEASFPEDGIDSVYEGLSLPRRALVEPVRLTDSLLTAAWLSKPYEGLGFREDDKSSFYTSSGERVRSKSEVIIADALRRLDIPYKYECPLTIGGRTIYPDFTILDVKRRCTLFLEHFGMMDDPAYSVNFTRKIAIYEDAGIYPGERLIMTFESANAPLDTRRLEKTIRHYLQAGTAARAAIFA